MSGKSVKQKFQAGVSSKSVKQECQERVSSKECLAKSVQQRVKQECPVKSVQQECQECPAKVSSKSVKKERQERVSRKSAQQECPARLPSKSVLWWVWCGVWCLGWLCVGWWVGVLCCVMWCLVCGAVGCFLWSCSGVLCVGRGGLLCWLVCWIVVSLNANARATLIENKEQTMCAKIVLVHSGSWVLSVFFCGCWRPIREAGRTWAVGTPSSSTVLGLAEEWRSALAFAENRSTYCSDWLVDQQHWCWWCGCDVGKQITYHHLSSGPGGCGGLFSSSLCGRFGGGETYRWWCGQGSSSCEMGRCGPLVEVSGGLPCLDLLVTWGHISAARHKSKHPALTDLACRTNEELSRWAKARHRNKEKTQFFQQTDTS